MQTVSSNELLSTLSKVTIIGNANGKLDIPSSGATFIFNGTKPDNNQSGKAETLINISNGPFAGSTCPFVISGSLDEHDSESLTLQLIEIAESLEKELNCWPSTGLVTIVLMSRLSTLIEVKRMSLLPSLKREMEMLIEEHLPCMVHNWLGERRIALAISTPNLSWPELQLTQPLSKEALDNHAELADYNYRCPFALLTQVHQHAPNEFTPSVNMLNILSYLSTTHIELWLQHSTQEKLLSCELMFFNQTPEQTASFWYLVDNQASQYLDDIRHRLAYCQQVLNE